MERFFTSDTHFFHELMLTLRKFNTMEEMNEKIVTNWNNDVGKNDLVYHIGDFMLPKSKYMTLVDELLYRLNGKIILIKGSHDKICLSQKNIKRFENIYAKLEIRIDNQCIFLNHECHKVWPKSHYGSWHLFGHSHGGLDEYCKNEGKLLDIGVDSHNYKMWNFSQIKEVMDIRPMNFNDLRRRKR